MRCGSRAESWETGLVILSGRDLPRGLRASQAEKASGSQYLFLKKRGVWNAGVSVTATGNASGRWPNDGAILGPSSYLQEVEQKMRLENRTAIITGAGNGIGRATAELFAAEGANIVVAELETEAGEETVGKITAAGGAAIFHQTDISDEDSVRAAVGAAVGEYGGIDILVNYAAAFVFGKIEDVTDADWHRVLGVNVIVSTGQGDSVSMNSPPAPRVVA